MELKNLLLTFALLPAFVLTAQIPSYVPLNGLKGYWPFTGNANDLSGNNNNGTVFGATLATDRFNSPNCAYSFNGISDYIKTNYAGILGGNARAISFWAKMLNPGAGGAHAVCWGGNTQASRSSAAFGAGGASFDSAFGYVVFGNSAANMFDDAWHHFVFQINGTKINQVEVYMDAVLLTTMINSFNPNNVLNTISTFSVHFGKADFTSSPGHFKGELDDIGIWDRKLTLCEIQQLYKSALPAISITGPTATICASQQVTLSATGVQTYTWNTQSNLPSIVVSPSVTTSYSVAGTCSTTAGFTIEVNAGSNLVASASSTSICEGESVVLTAMGADTYTWNNQVTTSSQTVTPMSTTTYSVSGTKSCTFTSSVVVNVLPNPQVMITPSAQTLCAGQQATLHATGAASYTWNTQAGAVSIVVSPLITTSYSVTGQTSGCTGTGSVTVVVRPVPSLTANASATLICFGENVQLSATGADAYTWSNQVSAGNQTVTPLQTTTYAVTGLSSGCAASMALTVFVSECTGIENNSGMNDLHVFPNPTRDLAMITGLREAAEIQVCNELGALVYKVRSSGEDCVIDLVKQPAGIYFVRIVSQGKVFHGKVIRN